MITLIVWVDQAGLHTQFSLDKDGGEVILSYIDGSVIDSVEYTEQDGNISMSRIPNGTGDFIATPEVTFEAPNGITTDLIFTDGFDG